MGVANGGPDVAWERPSSGARCRRAGIGVAACYAGRALTLGDAIWRAVSVLLAVRAVGVEAYLGGDQGGEGATLDEAHLDGWGSISINWTVSAGEFFAGSVLGLARRWGRDGDREVGEVVAIKAASSAAGKFRQGTSGARTSIDITTTVDDPHDNTTAIMSALPRSIGSRLLAPALRPSATRSLAPAYRTYATNEDTPHNHKTSSNDAPAVPLKSDSTQIRKESAAEGMRHAPDYNVAVDYRTSCVKWECSQSRAS